MKVIFASFWLGAQAISAQPSLSAKAAALIAPVHRAYEAVEAAQAKLPPANTTSEKLSRLLALDQAGRTALQSISLDALPEAEREQASRAIWAEIKEHDLANQAALKALVPLDGWFARSVYGKAAGTAAFLIVQHAGNDPAWMRQTLPKIRALVTRHEADGAEYALMYDRVALEFDHTAQRYGTQVSCVDGRWRPDKLEDPGHVDDRRKALGMAETEVEYLKHFEGMACR